MRWEPGKITYILLRVKTSAYPYKMICRSCKDISISCKDTLLADGILFLWMVFLLLVMSPKHCTAHALELPVCTVSVPVSVALAVSQIVYSNRIANTYPRAGVPGILYMYESTASASATRTHLPNPSISRIRMRIENKLAQ